MRFKYYLRGCGLGILLATVILMIGFHRSGSGRLSDEQIMQRASELGMVTPVEVEQLPAGTQGAGTEAMESQETNGDAPKDTGEPEASGAKDTDRPDRKDGSDKPDGRDAADKSDGEDGSDKPDGQAGSDGGDDTDKPDDSDEPDKPETVTVVVRRGEVCRELSQELFELGLVEDAETFRKFMQENGYDNLIRVGEFELTVGMEQEEIAKILTTKPE